MKKYRKNKTQKKTLHKKKSNTLKDHPKPLKKSTLKLHPFLRGGSQSQIINYPVNHLASLDSSQTNISSRLLGGAKKGTKKGGSAFGSLSNQMSNVVTTYIDPVASVRILSGNISQANPAAYIQPIGDKFNYVPKA